LEETKKKTIIEKIWDFFASVTLAVVIFSAIGLTSIVGTILEQNAEPEKNISVLVKMFGVGHETAHSIYGILDSFGFMNMYHSWWFETLLFLFAANLIICSLDRLPRILKLVKEKVHPLTQEHLEKMSIRKALSIKAKGENIRDAVLEAFKKTGFKPVEAQIENGLQFYAEKGNFSRLGVYITHLSVLIILIGGLIGMKFGFSGYLNLPEGEVSPVAYDNAKPFPLGFEIRCDNFEVEYYEGSDQPKAYKSWLSVIKNGKKVIENRPIVVNDPLSFEGVTFYQSSFGPASNNFENGIFILRLVSKDGKTTEVNLKKGDTFTIPGTSVEGQITNFSPALALDQSGKAFTYGEQMVNPAIFIEFKESGKETFSGWILKRYPQTWDLRDGNRVEFLTYWGVEYTGLQVRKDPGVGLVYLGCIIMAIGLYITFFISHRRIWINVVEEKNTTKISIGASANKNRASFEKKIEKLAGFLSAGAKGGNK
jgi:cytochrome c biogenesis protein